MEFVFGVIAGTFLLAFTMALFSRESPATQTYMCHAGHGFKTSDELMAYRWWERHQDCEKTLHNATIPAWEKVEIKND